MMQDDRQNPAEVSIRRARHDDYAAFCRLFPELLVDDPIPGLDAWTSALSPSTWVATVDGEVLGYCYVQEYLETGYVRHVVVSPTARKKGLGRALMRSAAESLRSHGKQSWRLNVRPSNQAARALYERMGLHEKYLAKALRLPWSALTALPTGKALVEVLTPAGDEAIERQFDIPRGQLAAARGMGRLLLEATSNSGRTALGLAAFDPKFPGAFPFRVRDFDAVTPLLSAVRQHVPTDRYINLVAEDDQPLADLLISVGATLNDEILHMEGLL